MRRSMILEINSITVAPGRAPGFESAFAECRPLLLGTPGCRSVELLRSVEQVGRYQVRVGWDRLEDHLELYPRTAEARRIRELLLPMIESADMGHFEPVGEAGDSQAA
jgi:hypothetical protein